MPCSLHAAMVTTPAVPLDTIVESLESLSSQFVTAVLRLESHDAGRVVDNMLKQLGEALAIDHASYESFSVEGPLGRAPRAWTRPGSRGACEPTVAIPVVAAGHRLATLSLSPLDPRGPWPAVLDRQVKVLAGLIAFVDYHVDRVNAAARAAFDSARGTDAPDARGDDEGGDDGQGSDFEDIIGESPALRIALKRLLEVAPTDASVVLVGETGTGKELFAREVHMRSRRRGRPFVRVNCAALPPTLIESELFGHERGAFTGAVSTRRGRFELAHTGTLFLDEVGDLPADVQAKLLRVLQEGEFERVGSSESRRVDVRIVAATHHDLGAAVKEGRFRADLFYRLNVYPIALPPLRERREDITRLIWFFINRRQRALNRRFTSISSAMLAALQQHAWPGNVRELENVVERAMIHSTGNTLVLDDGAGMPVWAARREGANLEEVERHHIESVLRRCRWRINGPGNAAELLGLHPNTLRFRMKKLGVQRPKEPAPVLDAGRLSA
jgi:formate hydrogenlyase transcriptional activator